MRVDKEERYVTHEICFRGVEANTLFDDTIGTPVTGSYEFTAAYCHSVCSLLHASASATRRLTEGVEHMEQ